MNNCLRKWFPPENSSENFLRKFAAWLLPGSLINMPINIVKVLKKLNVQKKMWESKKGKLPPSDIKHRILAAEARLNPEEHEALIAELNSGKKISFVNRRERYIELMEWLGISWAEIQKRLNLQNNEFTRFKSAIELDRLGHPHSKIGKRLGVSRRTVSFWIGGEREPRSISGKQLRAWKKQRKKIIIKPGGSDAFGYIIGCYFGNAFKLRSQKQARGEVSINLETTDKEFSDEFAHALQKSIGLKSTYLRREPRKRNIQPTHLRWVIATGLVQILNRESRYKAVIPMKFLQKKNERIEFLRGLFDSRETIRRRSPQLVKHLTFSTKNQLLAKTVSLFLTEEGVRNNIQRDNELYVVSIPRNSFPNFREKIGLRIKEKEKQLAT